MDTSQSPNPSAYRWVVVVATALIIAVVMGQMVSGISVYLLPLETSEGWGRAQTSAINSFGLLGVASGGLVVGRSQKLFRARTLTLLGVVMMGVGMIGAGMSTNLAQLYAIFFITGFATGAALFAPLMGLVGNWFSAGGGLAIGIVSAGQAMGQGLMPFSGAFLIESFGWRGALIAQGCIALVVLIPLALLIRPAPDQPASMRFEGSDDTYALSPNMVALVAGIAGMMCCICMSVPLIHLVPLIQGCGFTAPQAGGVLFVMLMVAISGRVAFGYLSDRIGALQTWIIASLWQTAMIFGFTLLGSLQSFTIYAVIYGFGYAGVMTGVLTTVRSLVPPEQRARVTGLTVAFTFAGHGIGGYQGGLFYELTGGYTWSYANAAIAGMLNLALLLGLFAYLNRGGRKLAVLPNAR